MRRHRYLTKLAEKIKNKIQTEEKYETRLALVKGKPRVSSTSRIENTKTVSHRVHLYVIIYDLVNKVPAIAIVRFIDFTIVGGIQTK